MKVLIFIFILFNLVFADNYDNLFDKNYKHLEECKDSFVKLDGFTTINFLNKTTMDLFNLYKKSDMDYPYIVSEIVDCFYKENILVQADVMVDSYWFFLINLNNKKRISIDGMPYLSPDRKHFATSYCGMDETRISLYSLKNNKVKRIFTKEFLEDDCCTKKMRWINKQKVAFDFVCDNKPNNIKSLFLNQQRNKEWKLYGN